MALSIEQAAVLDVADRRGRISADDDLICPGIHFCPDWDGLAVCADSPEAEGCTCDQKRKS